MDVLLLEDVYNLGRAGEVKKVANGFGRNYLFPQGMAVPATKGAVKQAEKIAAEASKRREVLNAEMQEVAKQFDGLLLTFPARAGETGKLYGSITTQQVSDALNEKLGLQIDKRQIHAQPLRLLGLHKVAARLTVDVIPEFEVVIYREGEDPKNYMVAAEELAAKAESSAPVVEAQAEAAESEDAVEEAASEAAEEAPAEAAPAAEEAPAEAAAAADDEEPEAAE